MRLAFWRARPRDRELPLYLAGENGCGYGKIVSARRRNQHAGRMRYPSILKPIFRSAINPTPTEKLVSTRLFPCFNISPTTACAAR